ncbi:MAG: hypothetical protein JW750_05005 [Anaerolineaceae bacterium]|nr:hypothetical protein [Anaerolineaceae bacterium]
MNSVLNGDLDFHGENSSYASHAFHSFPAKFPPQLPEKFIQKFSQEGDLVLDPMAGSGTTIVEAALLGRRSIGFDIDPLAILLNYVKTHHLDPDRLRKLEHQILVDAKHRYDRDTDAIQADMRAIFCRASIKFIDYWFDNATQSMLYSMISEIYQIEDIAYRSFFKLLYSSIIITKSGGVSLAFDLAHTRPHKVKAAISHKGNILYGENEIDKIPESRKRFLVKKVRSPYKELHKNFTAILNQLIDMPDFAFQPIIQFGNALQIPLKDDSVDLVVTSPPYASNAIDYMRAHKFSLVWFGHSIDQLSLHRKKYIGGEALEESLSLVMPDFTSSIISKLGSVDFKKSRVLHRYYSEMTLVLKEMYRVLKPGKFTFIVVGNSIMRGLSTETPDCLVEIGNQIGFINSQYGVRNLDRNRRMLPTAHQFDQTSQIQQRMHQEFVIGYQKP